MPNTQIALVYFSGTLVTHAYAKVMHAALRQAGAEVALLNVTGYAARQEPLPVDEVDGVIFGFPVYADFAPSVINEWLPTLEGGGKPCATFFTYGARTTGYAHFHTKRLLERAGFRVLFTGEFLGRHTFNLGGWRILPDRPDEADFAVAREFAELALARFAEPDPAPLRLQKPFGYNDFAPRVEEEGSRWRGSWCRPARVTDSCSMCRRCETECPTRAFDAETGHSDPARCIDCLHCVTICPDGVIELTNNNVGTSYEGFKEDWCLDEAMMAAKKSRIITEAWQAAF